VSGDWHGPLPELPPKWPRDGRCAECPYLDDAECSAWCPHCGADCLTYCECELAPPPRQVRTLHLPGDEP